MICVNPTPYPAPHLDHFLTIELMMYGNFLADGLLYIQQ